MNSLDAAWAQIAIEREPWSAAAAASAMTSASGILISRQALPHPASFTNCIRGSGRKLLEIAQDRRTDRQTERGRRLISILISDRTDSCWHRPASEFHRSYRDIRRSRQLTCSSSPPVQQSKIHCCHIKSWYFIKLVFFCFILQFYYKRDKLDQFSSYAIKLKYKAEKNIGATAFWRK